MYFADRRPSLQATKESIRQLVDQNRQSMRRTGVSISNPPAGASNLVLPVSRDALPALWAVFGE
jgi:hypothetical protein